MSGISEGLYLEQALASLTGCRHYREDYAQMPMVLRAAAFDVQQAIEFLLKHLIYTCPAYRGGREDADVPQIYSHNIRLLIRSYCDNYGIEIPALIRRRASRYTAWEADSRYDTEFRITPEAVWEGYEAARDWLLELAPDYRQYFPELIFNKLSKTSNINLKTKGNTTMKKADIGLIGLAVMGENLVMNMESKGFTVAVFNRTTSKVTDFVEGRAKGLNIIGTYSLEELIENLAKPRKVMLMVKAGQPVDDFIDKLLPLLDDGDVIIDGGNSHFPDTMRRTEYVESKGKLYIGTGVSGGEEGALKGPSMMPGGSPAAWPIVKPILQAICAKVEDGSPCCDWVGENGAGHFVKMVHNGIEYGDMQLICEAYQLMRDYLGMTADEMHEVFADWMHTELDSYLVEITRDILAYKDTDGEPIVNHILDTAGQKGTGKWTGIAALDEGVPLTLIGEAVFARCLSAMKEERVAASKALGGDYGKFNGTAEEKKAFIESIRQALLASKIISYAQGYTLMKSAAKTYNWNLNYGGIALMWRGGCIIRSVFLGKIKDAYDKKPDLSNLLLDDYFNAKIKELVPAWRKVVSAAVTAGIPTPAFTSALSYFDGYRSEFLPANLLQAQRDYFGAHTYERLDSPRGEFFHTNWTGHGGDTSASTYTA